MIERRHSFSEDDVSVKHQEANWFRRGVAEAIHIKNSNPDLNRDRGRHVLPNIYREILTSRDSSPTSGSRDQAAVQSPMSYKGVWMCFESFSLFFYLL